MTKACRQKVDVDDPRKTRCEYVVGIAGYCGSQKAVSDCAVKGCDDGLDLCNS